MRQFFINIKCMRFQYPYEFQRFNVSNPDRFVLEKLFTRNVGVEFKPISGQKSATGTVDCHGRTAGISRTPRTWQSAVNSCFQSPADRQETANALI